MVSKQLTNNSLGRVAKDTYGGAYVRTARADFCIPNSERVFYFEIQMTRLKTAEDSTIDPEIGIGISEEHASFDQLVGLQEGSWGFQGDDGQLYEQQGKGKKLNEGYGSQDIVGCGIDFSKNVGFLTKNGRYLGKMTRDSAIFADLGVSTNS